MGPNNKEQGCVIFFSFVMINQICIGKNCNFGRVNYNSNNRQVQFSNGSKSSGHQIIWVWNGVWKLNCIHDLVRLKGFQIPFKIQTICDTHSFLPFKIQCCVFQPANACLHMRWHGLKRLKTFKNHEKSLTWSSRAHDEDGTFFMIFVCFW